MIRIAAISTHPISVPRPTPVCTAHDPLAHGRFRSHRELRDFCLPIGGAAGFGLEPGWDFVERYRA